MIESTSPIVAQKEAYSGNYAEQARAVLSHLRVSPGDRHTTPDELAERLRIPSDVVSGVLEGVALAEGADAKLERAWRTFRIQLKTLVGQVCARPIPFMGASFATITLLGLIVALLQALNSSFATWMGFFAICVVVLLIWFHSTIFYRAGKWRWVALEVIGCFLAPIPSEILLYYLEGRGNLKFESAVPIASEERMAAYIGLGTNLSVAIFIGLCAGLVSTVGLYVRALENRSREKAMDRRELAVRLVEVQDLLRKAPKKVTQKPSWRASIAMLGQQLVWLSLASGVALGGLTSADSYRQADLAPAFCSGWGVLFAVVLGLLASQMADLLLSLAALFGATIALALTTHFRQAWVGFVDPTWLFVGILLAGLAVAIMRIRQMRQRVVFAKHLAEHRPHALLQELARLDWHLLGNENQTSVLVVDAASSTAMKLNADPLFIEVSFHAYQTWIAALARANGGSVLATAGDGAILTFREPAMAYRTAKELQTEIGEFNQTSNRLQAPFRIRIGLHSGVFRGQPGSMVYSEVIDIAAHVEKVAPVGGIALTQRFAESIEAVAPEERFVGLQDRVDGQPILVASDPTGKFEPLAPAISMLSKETPVG